jgi:succinoglycan biosynthesis transport protein ExoP
MDEYMLRGEVPVAPAEEVIELRQIFRALRRHPWLILGTTAALMAVGTLWASRETQLFRATAVVQMSGARGLSDDVGVAVPVFGRESDPLLSKVELIKARGIVGVGVDSLGLQLLPGPRLPIGLLTERHVESTATADSIHLVFSERGVRASTLTGSTGGAYGEPIHLSGARFVIPERPKAEEANVFVLTRETAIMITQSGIGAERREGTDIVDISFEAEDPIFAQSVVNATVQIFKRQSLLSAQERSRLWRGFVARQLAETDSLLEDAQARLSLFRSQRQLSRSSDRLAAEEREVIELESRRDQLRSDLGIYRSLQAKLASPEKNEREEALSALASWPEISNNVVIGTLHRQRLQYQRALDSLMSGPWRITRDHPDAKRIIQLIEETDRSLQSAVGSHIDALDARLGALTDLRSSAGPARQKY